MITSIKTYIFLIIFIISRTNSERLSKKKFPKDFLFGTSTSAYQIEGAWNKDGKGENIWDRYIHENPSKIIDGSNADIACDSYHKYEEDVRLLKHTGVQFYRFSLSWSRILPTGLSYTINQDGVDYYNALIDLLLKNNIIPMVTLFHWDTPQPLEDMGGFSSELMIEWFEDYARLVFELFGDKVKYWITFNEPARVCVEGYGMDAIPPAYNSGGIGDYFCAHNLLKAHAEVYHMYKNEFKSDQQGKLGISIDSPWFEPYSTSEDDIAAARRAIEFWFGWYADPIFHSNGDYPVTMKYRIANRSISEGFPNSRLPVFSEKEIALIKGSSDYLGLNYFETQLVSDIPEYAIDDPSYIKDRKVNLHPYPNEELQGLNKSQVLTWGFRNLLNYINNRYKKVEIYVTENGISDNGELEDTERVDYILGHLNVILQAIYEDKVNIKAYSVWSLMDNFDWRKGYTLKYGLYHVNFQSPNRTRMAKKSVEFYKEIITKRKLTSSSHSSTKYVKFILFLSILLSFKLN